MARTYAITPLSFFNSEFNASPEDGRGPSFRIKLNSFGEQGSIQDDAGHSYNAVKNGLGSGRWSLTGSAGELAVAQKSSPLSRRFAISLPHGTLTLKSDNPFSRSFSITGHVKKTGQPGHTGAPQTPSDPSTPIGAITPAGIWTRRATVTFDDAIEPPVAMFCFWLAALMWRRRARQN